MIVVMEVERRFRKLVFMLYSLILAVNPLNQWNCSERILDTDITECFATMNTVFDTISSAGVILDSEEEIAMLCDPSVVDKLNCIFWLVTECRDLDVNIFPQIKEGLEPDGFNLQHALIGGGLETFCDLMGPCFEVSQCYALGSIDPTTTVQSITEILSSKSDIQNVESDQGGLNELPFNDEQFYNTVWVNGSLHTSTAPSKDIFGSTVNGHNPNNDNERPTTVTPFYDANFNDIGEESMPKINNPGATVDTTEDFPRGLLSESNTPMRGDTPFGRSRNKRDTPTREGTPIGHVFNKRDTPTREDTPIGHVLNKRDSPSGGDVGPVHEAWEPPFGEMPLEIDNQPSIYVTTPLSDANSEKKSQFLSLTITICSTPSSGLSCKISSVKKCSMSSYTRIEKKLLNAIKVSTSVADGVPNPDNFEFVQTHCSSDFHQDRSHQTCTKGVFVPIGSSDCKKENALNVSRKPLCDKSEFGKVFIWEVVEPTCGNKLASFLEKNMCLTFPELPEECSETAFESQRTSFDISESDVIRLSFGFLTLSVLLVIDGYFLFEKL